MQVKKSRYSLVNFIFYSRVTDSKCGPASMRYLIKYEKKKERYIRLFILFLALIKKTYTTLLMFPKKKSWNQWSWLCLHTC